MAKSKVVRQKSKSLKKQKSKSRMRSFSKKGNKKRKTNQNMKGGRRKSNKKKSKSKKKMKGGSTTDEGVSIYKSQYTGDGNIKVKKDDIINVHKGKDLVGFFPASFVKLITEESSTNEDIINKTIRRLRKKLRQIKHLTQKPSMALLPTRQQLVFCLKYSCFFSKCKNVHVYN